MNNKDSIPTNFENYKERNEQSCLRHNMINIYKNKVQEYLNKEIETNELVSSSIIVFNLHEKILEDSFKKAFEHIAEKQKIDVATCQEKINPINWDNDVDKKKLIEKTNLIIQLCEDAIQTKQQTHHIL